MSGPEGDCLRNMVMSSYEISNYARSRDMHAVTIIGYWRRESYPGFRTGKRFPARMNASIIHRISGTRMTEIIMACEQEKLDGRARWKSLCFTERPYDWTGISDRMLSTDIRAYGRTSLWTWGSSRNRGSA